MFATHSFYLSPALPSAKVAQRSFVLLPSFCVIHTLPALSATSLFLTSTRTYESSGHVPSDPVCREAHCKWRVESTGANPLRQDLRHSSYTSSCKCNIHAKSG